MSLTGYHRSVLYGSIRNDILSLANAIENLSKIEHHILLGVNSPSLPLTYLDLENFAFAQGNLWRSIVTKQSNAEIAAGYILYNHILGSLKFQPVVQLGREIFGKSDQLWCFGGKKNPEFCWKYCVRRRISATIGSGSLNFHII